jgi:hypothetical protein
MGYVLAMGFNRGEVESIAHFVTTQLARAEAEFSQHREKLTSIISAILVHTIDEEEKIEKEATALLKQHSSGMNLDSNKAFRLIKKEIAKKRNFPL